jgi:hypothetical protein
VLLLVESTDLVFALDSVPAVFSVTRDAFIVFTSNVFAILGLRSLYFLLAGALGLLPLSEIRPVHRARFCRGEDAHRAAQPDAAMVTNYTVPTTVALLVIAAIISGGNGLLPSPPPGVNDRQSHPQILAAVTEIPLVARSLCNCRRKMAPQLKIGPCCSPNACSTAVSANRIRHPIISRAAAQEPRRPFLLPNMAAAVARLFAR